MRRAMPKAAHALCGGPAPLLRCKLPGVGRGVMKEVADRLAPGVARLKKCLLNACRPPFMACNRACVQRRPLWRGGCPRRRPSSGPGPLQGKVASTFDIYGLSCLPVFTAPRTAVWNAGRIFVKRCLMVCFIVIKNNKNQIVITMSCFDGFYLFRKRV